jgi:hypothetical protein
MDFIERVFALSPDGGAGAYELLLFTMPIIGICALWLPRLRAHTARRRHL